MKVRLIASLPVSLVLLAACATLLPPKNKPLSPHATIGMLRDKEVIQLRARIASLQFPLTYSVTKLIPPTIKPDNWAIYDPPPGASDPKSFGWGGSLVVLDYWLNEDFILRIGCGIFSGEGPPTSQWAVIISSQEQETYNRTRYPQPKEPNKAPEPTSGTVTPPAEPGVAPVPPVAHL